MSASEWERKILRKLGYDDLSIDRMGEDRRRQLVEEATDNFVDAEFTEVDDDRKKELDAVEPPRVYPNPKQSIGAARKSSTVTKAVFLCIGVAVVLWVFIHKNANTRGVSEVPGWIDLLPCSYMVSIDGTKQLILFENHRVTFYDNAPLNGRIRREQAAAVEGTWVFEDTLKQYSVVLNGETTPYSIVRPEAADACLLIKGDLESADLRHSWFSSTVDPREDDDGPDRPER